MQRGKSFLPLLAAALSAAACERFTDSPTEARMPDVSPYVTASLAEQLTPEGRFRFPPPKAPDDVPIITEQRARELAVAYMRTWGGYRRGEWAYERGAPLPSGDVVPADRIFFAETPHARFPDTYHPASKRMYGPMYVVPMEASGELVAYLAISAYGTDLGIRADGTIESPRLGGSYFFAAAVAPNPSQKRFRFEPVGPEEAVERVSRAAGARAALPPKLILQNAGWHPATALWKVTLDRPVKVRRKPHPGRPEAAVDPAPALVRDLYVAPGGELRIPTAQQPAHVRVGYTAGPPTAGGAPQAVHQLPRRADLPLVFDAVTLETEGG
jgi:hypothetical protein